MLSKVNVVDLASCFYTHSSNKLEAEDCDNNFWFGLYNANWGKWNAATYKIAVYKNLYGNESKEPTVIDEEAGLKIRPSGAGGS